MSGPTWRSPEAGTSGPSRTAEQLPGDEDTQPVGQGPETREPEKGWAKVAASFNRRLLCGDCLRLVVECDAEQRDGGAPLKGINTVADRLTWQVSTAKRHARHLEAAGILKLDPSPQKGQGWGDVRFRLLHNPARGRYADVRSTKQFPAEQPKRWRAAPNKDYLDSVTDAERDTPSVPSDGPPAEGAPRQAFPPTAEQGATRQASGGPPARTQGATHHLEGATRHVEGAPRQASPVLKSSSEEEALGETRNAERERVGEGFGEEVLDVSALAELFDAEVEDEAADVEGQAADELAARVVEPWPGAPRCVICGKLTKHAPRTLNPKPALGAFCRCALAVRA